MQVITMHLNHMNKLKKDKIKRLTEVVPVTGWRGQLTTVRTGTGQL